MQNCCLGKKLSLNENLIDKGIIFVGDNSEDKFISYRELYETSLKTLGLIQRHRIKKGSKVIIYIEDEEEYIYAVWACVLGGFIAVPVSVSNSSEDYKSMLNIWDKLENTYVIISENLAEKVNKVYQQSSTEEVYGDLEEKFIFIEDCLEEDILGTEYEGDMKDTALIMFSSGSTSEPKGICLSHENIVNAVEDAREHLKIKEDDVFLNWMPLTHAIGLNFFHILPLINKVNQVLIDPKLFIKNPMIWMEKVNEYRATTTISPNVGFQQFVKNFDSSNNIKWDLSCVRSFIGSAEPLSEDLLSEFLDVVEKYNLKRAAMKNLYGMTESVLGITLTACDKSMEFIKLDRNNLDMGNKIKIIKEGDGAVFAVSGTPLKGLRIRVCSDDGEVLVNEIIGNIQVKGINMTSGYYKNDVANKGLYSDDRWLRTGDIGFIKDGDVIITGRAKDIIILNGQNLYANDIERVARKVNIPEIEKIIACGVFDNKLHGEKLILFLKYNSSIDDFILYKNKVKSIVSKYMNIPIEDIIPIKEVPETASGKVKREILIKKYLNKDYEEVIEEIKLKEKSVRKEEKKSTSNNDEVTNTVIEICRKILNNSDINADDDLFEFGLDSILIIKIQAEVQKKLNCDIKISDFINNNTINLLSQISKKNEGNEKNKYPLLESNKADLYEPFTLTEVQMAYEIGRNEKLEGGGVCTHFYHEIRTKYDIKKLNVCLNKIINNYPMMRVVFDQYGKQRILKDLPEYKIVNEDISTLTPKEKEEMILKERNRMSHQVFDVEKWPLFEFKSFKISDKENYLFVSLDLIIADAASIFKLGEVLVDMYNDDERVLPNLEFTFRDYMLGNEKLKKSHMYAKDKEYWQNKIDDFPTAPALSYKTDVSKLKKPRYKRLSNIIDKETWKVLKDLAKKNRITPSALLCTAYAKVMAFWSNQNHLALNLTAFNRYPFNKDVDEIFGDFTSVIPLDIHIKTSNTKSLFDEAIELQKVILESLEHRHYDGIEFIRDLRINNKLGIDKAVMPIVFSSLLFNSGRYAWREMGNIDMAISQTSQVFIDNQVMEYDEVLSITWDYVEQLFDEEVINKMFEQYIEIIKSLAKENNVYKLTINDYAKNLIEKFNDTDIERDEKTLHGMFQKVARKVPDSIAVSLRNDSITYRELNDKSNQVANYLIQKNTSRNDYVGVIAHRRIETIINILGILKAGSAYIPMEPGYPQERIDYIVRNSNIDIVLSEDSYNKLNIQNEDIELIREDNHPEDMAYVIYTSGSTGRPKGVKIKHSAAVNTIEDINEKFEVRQEDKVIGLSSMCFDLSVYDIFGALSSGAELVLIEDQRNVENIKEVMMKKEITIWNSVPAIMQLFIENEFGENDEDNENYWEDEGKVQVDLGWTSNLRLVLMSGDWIPLKLPDKIKNIFLNADVVGLGGATEASIWSNYFVIDEVEDDWNSIPYGYPLGNQKFYALNFDKEICPIGVKGELYIGGKGIAEGYLNEEEKTKNSFIYHENLGRIYKTGDYGIIKKQGYMEFLGRKDNQIKIRGYRIELGEIQNKLLENKNIKKVAVIEQEDDNENKYLCAYVVADKNISVKELRAYLIERLPEYMVPNYFVKLEEIPLTTNGKVNRKELPKPSEPILEEVKEYIEPKNEIEKELYDIWKTILGKDDVGINDNFFEVGGNSMLLIKMYKEIDKKYPRKLKMGDMFSSTTISKLAKSIEKKKGN